MRYRTVRLHLEPQVADHAAAMFHILSDVRLYDYVPSKPPPDVEWLRERFARLESRRSPDGTHEWLNWTVFHEEAPIGYVQATVDPKTAEAEIGYMFGWSYWGRGFAFEAIDAMIAGLRADFSVREFRASVDRRNARSIRLLARLGFTVTPQDPELYALSTLQTS